MKRSKAWGAWLRGTNAVVLGLAVIGIFILATLFLHSVKGIQWDFTTNKKYTLSEQTLSALKAIDKDVSVKIFTGGNADSYASRQVTDLAKEYAKQSGNITYDEIDMVKQPAIAKEYEVDPYGMVVVESGQTRKSIYFNDMFQAGQTGTYQFSGEEKLTQALSGLFSTEKYPVYVLSGHGEATIGALSTLRAGLEGDNYEVKELNLYKEGKVPEDARMLLLLGPQNDLSDSELGMIREYLKGSGKLYVSLGYAKDMSSWKNIDALLSDYGVQNQKAVVIEPKRTVFNDPLTIVPEYGLHEIVNKLDQNNYVSVMTLATSLTVQPKEDWKQKQLLHSSTNAYGETDLALLVQGKSAKDDKDISAPLHLGYAIESGDGQPKAVVMGATSFLTDALIREQGNRDLAMNSIGWLMEQQNSITIRPREEAQMQQAFIYPAEGNLIFYGCVIVFPFLFLITGGVIWWRRRKG
ncbi:GldG family protein [Paenibacillus sp. y28]|uniref:GldG family protein n=1 Tax=Paenibacillus sp. y28 TaxID=3129110 RepID=UPI003019804B